MTLRLVLALAAVSPLVVLPQEPRPAAVPGAPAAADLSFVRSPDTIAPAVEQGVAVADLNGDGLPDACFQGESARIFFGDGRGGFRDGGQRLDARAGRPEIVDVDRDGDLDVVVGDAAWTNDGHGVLTRRPELMPKAEEGFWRQTPSADVDGDGDPDLVALKIPDSVRVWLNDGTGRFADSGQRLGEGTIGKSVQGSLAVGDVDGDGDADAVVAGWKWEGSEICPNRVWLNDGKGRFTDGGQLLDEGASHVHGLALVDLDGDRRPEIVMGIQDRDRSGRVWRNDGHGRFTPGQTLAGEGGEHVGVADMDGDGRPDVIVAGTREPTRVWLSRGDGTLVEGARLMSGRWDWDAGAGDFDRDGKPDLVTVGFKMREDRKPIATAPQVWIRK